jgi:predicted RNA-binding protein YlqC (UPF0109 family)
VTDRPDDLEADDAGLDVDDDFVEDDETDDGETDDDATDDAEEIDGNRKPAATASNVLEFLVRQLVDEPDGVEVDAVDRRGGVQLEVRVAPGDMGRVIGKRGRTAQAIRAVTRAAAVKDGVEVNIEFME